MGKIIVSAESSGDDLILRVSDNGAGMNQAQVAALRAGLYQDRHTGLGLVNVHRRIRLHCGANYGLSFESTPGKGSTIGVCLPRKLVGGKEV